jgi:Icc-related predicted phosphoesterase
MLIACDCVGSAWENTMTILHVTDFHFNKLWFDWLLHRAPAHDLTVMSGDMLDIASATSHRKQIAWVSDWLDAYPRPMSVASGNHDLEWHDDTERWLPAYWLRYIANPHVWSDGQRIEWDGTSILNLGCATRPKGGKADIWVVHAAPTNTLVTARSTGGDGGDPDLAAAVHRYAPRLVLSGHVHDPLHWCHSDGSTVFLNPGHNAQAEVPNHILVRTEDMSGEFVGSLREPVDEIRLAAPVLEGAESTAAVV